MKTLILLIIALLIPVTASAETPTQALQRACRQQAEQWQNGKRDDVTRIYLFVYCSGDPKGTWKKPKDVLQ